MIGHVPSLPPAKVLIDLVDIINLGWHCAVMHTTAFIKSQETIPGKSWQVLTGITIMIVLKHKDRKVNLYKINMIKMCIKNQIYS